MALTDHLDRLLHDALAVRAGLAHGDEPLVGEHRLHHHARAVAARHHQLVRLDARQQARGLEVGNHLLARGEAFHAGQMRGQGDAGLRDAVRVEYLRRCWYVAGQVEHDDARQPVALTDGVVVEVVRGCDLDHAGAELAVHIIIGDHRDAPASERQLDLAAD